MKTVKLIIVAFSVSALMGCFVLSCSADDLTVEETTVDMKGVNNKGLDNRVTVEKDVEWVYWLDVECGDFTDYLYGPVTAHVVTFYKDGEAIGTNYHTFGTIYSANTDEVFTVNEVSFDTFSETAIPFRFNIRGNMGSHYVGNGIWDYEPDDPNTGTLIIRKFICAGSNSGLDNRSTVEWDVPWLFDYWLDVECGDWTDVLIGKATALVVTHYKDGEAIGTIYHSTGTAKSENTGEEFNIREVSFDNYSEKVIDFHFNVKGNMGTQYIGNMSWEYGINDDPNSGIMITRKFKCLEHGGGN